MCWLYEPTGACNVEIFFQFVHDLGMQTFTSSNRIFERFIKVAANLKIFFAAIDAEMKFKILNFNGKVFISVLKRIHIFSLQTILRSRIYMKMIPYLSNTTNFIQFSLFINGSNSNFQRTLQFLLI